MKRKIFIVLCITLLVLFYFIRRDYLYFTIKQTYSNEMILLKEKMKKHPLKEVDGMSLPNFPESDDNLTVLEGIDTNQNHIRDDVELWIDYNARDVNERLAMRQLVQDYDVNPLKETLQNSETNTKEYFIKRYQAIDGADFCLINTCLLNNQKLSSNYDCVELFRKLRHILINNRIRQNFIENIFTKGNSTTYEISDLSTCKFKIRK